ncbi:hypothetical protein AZI86_07455 [Bdellovibrio bacteriovorus]|uniref:DUF1800 domain-containing protein n=1 Tax=Bdellovibrio bacteriovorus TaxID=959 RepID=A0A150WQV2_BDEBC|nr:hypothetical protein [Bdellovibrio bacteriovorus]KYG66862.1 hypothetical protein AZI86_07455 [Bdellovibrio bacteriovorus]
MKKFVLVLFITVQASSLTAHAAFEEGYFSPQDIIWNLYQKFDAIKLDSCQSLPNDLRSALGDSSALNGEVAVSTPNPAFLTWYTKCISDYLSMVNFNTRPQSEEVFKKLYKAYLNSKQTEVIRKYNPDLPLTSFSYILKFSSLTENDQKAHVADLVEWALGTDEEILSYGFITDVNQFRADLLGFLLKQSNQDAKNITELAITILLTRDEFLLY